jgi:hypothetical protein
VKLVEVDIVEPQPLQTLFAGFNDVLSRQPPP